MHEERPVNLRFDPSEDSAIHWAARSGVEHALSLRKLESLYARALPYIRTWAYALTTKYGWSDEPVELIGEMHVAVCLGRSKQPPPNEEPCSPPHVSRLVIPRQFASFLDPDLAHDWAAMFHNLMTPYTTPNATDIFQLGRAAGIPRPLQNILYLLQVLSPGLLLVRYIDEDINAEQVVDYGLPPSLWVGLHIEDLEDIFGASAAMGLYHAAEDPYCSSEVSSVAADSDDDSFDNDSFDSSSITSGHSDEELLSDWEEEDDYYQYRNKFDGADIELAGHGKPGAPGEPMLVNQPIHFDKHPTVKSMDYRHCDAECAYCGRCDERFAQQLMQRLSSMAVAI